MGADPTVRAHRALAALGRQDLDWVDASARAAAVIEPMVPFDRSCFHTVDPGTMLLTGSVNRNVGCSGTWLAEYEYVIDDVNKWWDLARTGRIANTTYMATGGDVRRSARVRSNLEQGIGDELRVSFVADGSYWGAAGLLRDEGRPPFTEAEVAFVASLSPVLAGVFRRAFARATAVGGAEARPDGPGVIVFGPGGDVELTSPEAERWVADIVQEPAPASPGASAIVAGVAATARLLERGADPLAVEARARVRTRSGAWLVIYGTPLAGGADGRIAVVIQPAAPNEVAPVVALAYGLTRREADVTRLCIRGLSTKEIALELAVSPYTVQDHFKSIFAKTGVRTRSELVGQIFLEHYVTRWEDRAAPPAGWSAKTMAGARGQR